MRLTDRQIKALKRAASDNGAALLPEVARQLLKKGLVHDDGAYDRGVGWGKTVRLRAVSLTEAGRRVLAEIDPEGSER